MVVKVIGVRCRPGVFVVPSTGEAKPYNNINIYCVTSLKKTSEDVFCAGETFLNLKIKNDKDVIRGIFSTEMTISDFVNMIGNEYNVFFDQYKNPDMITPLAPPAGKKGA